MRSARDLRRRLDALEPVRAPVGPPRVTFVLPDNGRGGHPPGEYRVGDVLLRIVPGWRPLAPQASGMAENAAQEPGTGGPGDSTGAKR
jgi:hypothetical protein